MSDMTSVIEPKSDQLNSDDLITGPRTITITGVKVAETGEQRVSIYFEGDKGRPWKPCKSMARILVSIWGPDSKGYIGKSLTLYRDPSVTWGGMQVGGIRISHMSDMDRDRDIVLTASQQKKAITKIRPLRVEQKKPEMAATHQPARKTMQDWLSDLDRDLTAATSEDAIHERMKSEDVQKMFNSDKLKPETKAAINAIGKKHLDRLASDDAFLDDVPYVEQASDRQHDPAQPQDGGK